jgi:hypothetical protein
MLTYDVCCRSGAMDAQELFAAIEMMDMQLAKEEVDDMIKVVH